MDYDAGTQPSPEYSGQVPVFLLVPPFPSGFDQRTGVCREYYMR